jgi:hypothetical protein
MKGRYCPVDGCDYGDDEEKTLPAVRSHINATNDGDHRWEDLKAAVEAQADEQTTETAEEQAEPAETDGSGEGPDPTEEYENQWSDPTDEDDDGNDQQETTDKPADDAGDDTNDDTSGTDGQQEGVGAAMSLVAGSLVVVLLYFLTDDGDDREVRDIDAEHVEDADAGATSDESPSDGDDVWGETFE